MLVRGKRCPLLGRVTMDLMVIDVSHILGNAGENVYLIDTQAHFAVAGEQVEGGQLQLIHQYLV